MKKALIITTAILGVLVVVAVAAGFLFWNAMQKPLYQPGMVRAGENLRAPLTPPEQSGEVNYWQVEPDIQLHHFSEGEGRNVLVIHGGPGFPFTESWPGLRQLTGDYRFHYYDQRGCGRSTRPIDRFSSSNSWENMQALNRALGAGAQVADIERIRRIIEEEKLILIGHSFGGFLASLYAAEFPQHVEAMILVAPADMLVMPQEHGGGLFETIRERLPESMHEEYDTYLEEYLDFRNVFSKSDAELAALNAEYVKYYEAVAQTPAMQQGEPGGWMVQAMYISLGLRRDYRGALKNVDVPVLVVHGSGDLQKMEASRTYSDSFPNARFHIMDGATHFPFYEQPEAFAALIGTFLGELE